MGSKSRIAKHIVPIIQRYIDENNIKKYYEPFVGGANIIDKIDCSKKIGSDLNKYLIALLNHVAEGGELYETVDKELYDKQIVFKNGSYINVLKKREVDNSQTVRGRRADNWEWFIQDGNIIPQNVFDEVIKPFMKRKGSD